MRVPLPVALADGVAGLTDERVSEMVVALKTRPERPQAIAGSSASSSTPSGDNGHPGAPVVGERFAARAEA
ncbi:MAG: hypothetical protein R6X02_29780 [Enhygromyxa sp.]